MMGFITEETTSNIKKRKLKGKNVLNFNNLHVA